MLSTEVTDESVKISGDTDIALYLKKFLGDLTVAQENELRITNKIQTVGDILFMDDFTIDKLTEFPESIKKKLKTIHQYLNIMSSDESSNYDKSIREMYFIVKNGERHDQTVNMNSKITTSSGLVSRIFRLTSSHKYSKVNTSDEEENVTSYDTSNEIKGNPGNRLRLKRFCNQVCILLSIIFLLVWPFPAYFWVKRHPNVVHRVVHRIKELGRTKQKVEVKVTPPNNVKPAITMEPVKKVEQSSPSIPGAATQKCPAGNAVTNCCCPQTCSNAILSKSVTPDFKFTCRERINYLMSHYNTPEKHACVKTATQYPSCGACNPDKCPVPVEK